MGVGGGGWKVYRSNQLCSYCLAFPSLAMVERGVGARCTIPAQQIFTYTLAQLPLRARDLVELEKGMGFPTM